MSDLRDRLRRLREQQQAGKPSEHQARSQTDEAQSAGRLVKATLDLPAHAPKQEFRPKHDEDKEAAELISQVQDELKVKGGTSLDDFDSNDELVDEDDDVDANLVPSYLQDTTSDPASGTQSLNAWLQKEQRSLIEDERRVQPDAQAALRDWERLKSQVPPSIDSAALRVPPVNPPLSKETSSDTADSSSKLIREIKDRPSLRKGNSSLDIDANTTQDSELADDLADAMGSGLGGERSAEEAHGTAKKEQREDRDEDEETEADELVQRLVHLRASSSKAAEARASNDAPQEDEGFLLPSAPTFLPETSSADAPCMNDDATLPPDLRSFSKLIRLNATSAAPDSLQARLDALKAHEAQQKAAQVRKEKADALRKQSGEDAKARILKGFGLPSAPKEGFSSKMVTAGSSLDGDEDDDDDDEDNDDDDTDTWCCICNEDASLRCVGCDGDLYCRQCWVEGHGNMGRDEIREHKIADYTPRRLRAARRGRGKGGGVDRGGPSAFAV